MELILCPVCEEQIDAKLTKCPHCDTGFVSKQDQNDSDAKICKYCGSPNESGSHVCQYCCSII